MRLVTNDALVAGLRNQQAMHRSSTAPTAGAVLSSAWRNAPANASQTRLKAAAKAGESTKDRWPDSRDPTVAVRGNPEHGYDDEGGWAAPRHPEDYGVVMRQWRKQTPHYEHTKNAADTLQNTLATQAHEAGEGK